MSFNLFMAGFWLILGGVLLAMQRIYPDQPGLTVLGTGVSLGWIALLLALYNLVRWWSSRSAAEARALEEAQEQRQAHHEQARTPPVVDPNFDFSKPPARPDEGGHERG